MIMPIGPSCRNDPATLLVDPAPHDLVRPSSEALNGGDDHNDRLSDMVRIMYS